MNLFDGKDCLFYNQLKDNMNTLPSNPTNKEKYLPAMNVESEAEAAEWLEICVQHRMSVTGEAHEEAENKEREAIALAAFYGFHESNETIEKVARLFHIEEEMKRMEHLLE